MVTIQLFPQTFLILFAFIFTVTSIVRVIRKKSVLKLFYVGIIETYILLLFSVVILPINIIDTSLLEGESKFLDYFQLVPFRTIGEMLKYNDFFSIQLIGNIVLLMPLPILIGYANREKHFVALFSKCAMVSVGIELIQVCIDFALQYPSRKFDVDDIILNVLGVLMGTVILMLLTRLGKIYNWIGENIVWKI